MMTTASYRSSQLVFAAVLLLALPLAAQKVPSQQRAARYLDSIRNQPSLLLAFVEQMPKGGDLHNHLTGAVYAENYIQWAAADGLCVDQKSWTLVAPPCAEQGRPAASDALNNPVLYSHLIDAFSMRQWSPQEGSAHDHFFAAFPRFDLVTQNHIGDEIASVAALAAQDHVAYLELMLNPDHNLASELGARTEWDDNFDHMRQQLQSNGLSDVVAAARHNLDEAEARVRDVLGCGGNEPAPGCNVTLRYIYHGLRGLPREQVFAQLLTGFELAQADSRVVGVNLVMPEDWYVPMHDFRLHMRMMDYLHRLYPKVHISLHAGEIWEGMVPPEGLSFHIRDSVEIGHAERIGHGVDVMHETDPIALLHEMSRRNVLVEICLTSNDMILGVRGNQHPLPIYMKYGVPVALATDDEGVARSNMTHEYLRAVESYDLSYPQLKNMARASLEHSFLPGASLWKDARAYRVVEACAADSPAKTALSSACRKFLDGSQKAQVQWREEGEFDKFEQKF